MWFLTNELRFWFVEICLENLKGMGISFAIESHLFKYFLFLQYYNGVQISPDYFKDLLKRQAY